MGEYVKRKEKCADCKYFKRIKDFVIDNSGMYKKTHWKWFNYCDVLYEQFPKEPEAFSVVVTPDDLCELFQHKKEN